MSWSVEQTDRRVAARILDSSQYLPKTFFLFPWKLVCQYPPIFCIIPLCVHICSPFLWHTLDWIFLPQKKSKWCRNENFVANTHTREYSVKSFEMRGNKFIYIIKNVCLFSLPSKNNTKLFLFLGGCWRILSRNNSKMPIKEWKILIHNTSSGISERASKKIDVS